MSKNEPPSGFPLGNTDPSKRGLGKTQKNLRKANKSGCLTTLLLFSVVMATFLAVTAWTRGLS